MRKITIVLALLVSTLIIATCERSDMYDLAKYGLLPQSAIYLYSIGLHTGNLDGRKGADQLCYNEGFMYHSLLSASTVKAFLSVSFLDELRFIVPVQFWHYPVMGISSTMAVTPVSNNWLDLMNGVTSTTIDVAAGIAGSSWWSGSAAGGSVSTLTCSEFKDSTAASLGELGSTIIDSGGNVTCNVAYTVLCIAY